MTAKKENIKDTGADPLGNGKYRMYPSGDIVDEEEHLKRRPGLVIAPSAEPLIFGRTWDEIKAMQQGKRKK